ncbi:MAG: hypothetical protein IPP07_29450, partial [Holophagales bacterium]|nr:hypothetical protein [Holophagales bacterium]
MTVLLDDGADVEHPKPSPPGNVGRLADDDEGSGGHGRPDRESKAKCLRSFAFEGDIDERAKLEAIGHRHSKRRRVPLRDLHKTRRLERPRRHRHIDALGSRVDGLLPRLRDEAEAVGGYEGTQREDGDVAGGVDDLQEDARGERDGRRGAAGEDVKGAGRIDGGARHRAGEGRRRVLDARSDGPGSLPCGDFGDGVGGADDAGGAVLGEEEADLREVDLPPGVELRGSRKAPEIRERPFVRGAARVTDSGCEAAADATAWREGMGRREDERRAVGLEGEGAIEEGAAGGAVFGEEFGSEKTGDDGGGVDRLAEVDDEGRVDRLGRGSVERLDTIDMRADRLDEEVEAYDGGWVEKSVDGLGGGLVEPRVEGGDFAVRSRGDRNRVAAAGAREVRGAEEGGRRGRHRHARVGQAIAVAYPDEAGREAERRLGAQDQVGALGEEPFKREQRAALLGAAES